MELLYVWVEKYRNFENFGFNLSGSDKFQYDNTKNQLSHMKVNGLPNGFFGDRIVGVTGVIGRNGAGKSNILELICKLVKGGNTSLVTNYLLITREHGKLICYYSFGENLTILSEFAIVKKPYTGDLNPLKVVYFSNVFDERKNDFDKNVADISVNNDFNKGGISRSRTESNFVKQLKFINSEVFKELGIELPERLQITSRVWSNLIYSSEKFEFDDNSDFTVVKFRQFFRDRIRDIKKDNKFIVLVKFSFLNDFLVEVVRSGRFNDLFVNRFLINFFLKFTEVKTSRTEEIIDILIDFINSDFIESSELGPYFTYDKYSKSSKLSLLVSQLSAIQNLKNFIYGTEIQYFIEGSRKRVKEFFTLKFSEDTLSLINDFIYFFEFSSSFEINWVGISSGHKAYLNLFSSLYQVLRFTRQSNLLLCIDEGDLYLHPKWQIEFFNKLSNILPKIYDGNIQLVLTSHSPFLISDLPRNNIIILDKVKEPEVIDGINLKKETFGGNLYDLYSEPFFLGQKRLSDFAYEKIKSALDIASKVELSDDDKEYIRLIKSIVGDKVIKFKLESLSND